MVTEQLGDRIRPGYYFSKRLRLTVQITAFDHPLPPSDDWEFIGSSTEMTSSGAIGRLLQRHPEIDADRLTFTVK